MTEPEITALLTRAGDDGGRPLETNLTDLLALAQADRSRRRARAGLGVLAAAAAVAAGVVLAPHVTSDEGRQVQPAAVAPTRAGFVSDNEVLRRCRPDGTWDLTHPERSYQVGDLVVLEKHGGTGKLLCQVPEIGSTAVASDQVYRTFSRSTAPLGTLCAAVAPRGSVPDLRHASVLAEAHAGNVAAALIAGADDVDYACAVSPPSWDTGTNTVSAVAVGSLYTASWERAAQGGGSTTYAVLAGQVDDAARHLEVGPAAGPTQTFPVGSGHVAALYAAPAEAGQSPLSWRLLADDGHLLASGTVD
ncbi:MAG: hypothetical protein JWO46_409 [Nocardioidaceae bacterium]|nr:hypothetical protein [Nocardioidaceae bacterium]